MDELAKTLLTAAGAAFGAALVALWAQHLKNRREDAIKYAEARQRFFELRNSLDKGYAAMTPDERTAFLEKFNKHSEWMTGVSAYLSVQQREDIHILKLSLIDDGRNPAAFSEARMERWMQAEERVFPSFTQQRRFYAVRKWWKKATRKFKKKLPPS